MATQVKALVVLAEKICNECASLRQETVKLVSIMNSQTCPFKEVVTTRVEPPPACHAVTGPLRCSYSSPRTALQTCPLSRTPLYHNGEIIMLSGVASTRKEVANGMDKERRCHSSGGATDLGVLACTYTPQVDDCEEGRVRGRSYAERSF